MSDKLKKFVRDHKEDFDGAEPAKDLWNKIDSKLEVKDPSLISSSWLSKLKYLGFSASILVVAIYVIASDSKEDLADKTKLDKKENVIIESKQEISNSASVQSPIENNQRKKIDGSKQTERTQDRTNFTLQSVKDHDTLKIRKEISEPISGIDQKEVKENNSDSISEAERKSVNVSTAKKVKFSVPAEPHKLNEYTGTLYSGSYFCNMLRAYKFPGKVGLDMGTKKNADNYKITMKTTSCSRLARVPSMKAIWLKGKTNKKIMFSLMEGFKSIQLIKKNGTVVTPEAVSHYYPGLLVISNYEGKFFNMAFEDKVDLILFFKDAEEGDKVVIDGLIEAFVKEQ